MSEARPPLLPIPELKHSISGLLERIQPLVDPVTLEQTRNKANQFMMMGGANLQKELQAYAKEKEPHSWLTNLWQKSYLDYRGSLNYGLNYLTTLDLSKLPPYESQAQLSAALVNGLTQAYINIASKSLEGESGKSGPLCMEQYSYLFAACRIPQKDTDKMFCGIKEGFYKNAHIVLFTHGNIYVLQVTNENGEAYSTQDISDVISQLLLQKDEPEPNIGILTSSPRDEATYLYEHLKSLGEGNIRNFEKIHSAIFALCIDTAQNQRSKEQTAFDQLYGQGVDRWFDKCIQVIVGGKDENVGFCNEHTSFDAAIWVSTLLGLNEHMKHANTSGASGIPPAARLKWATDDTTNKIIRDMQAGNAARGKELHIKVSPFEEFGATAIKAVKASPDAFFHLALQLAYFRQYGTLASTYEAVAMRHFHEGRTECMRPATTAALQFSHAMGDLSQGRDNLCKLARTAFEQHVAMIGICQRGDAPERHMAGLEAMLTKTTPLGQAEDIFEDEGYKTLRHDTISSSGLSASCMNLFCFAPVVKDGFGIGYIIDSDSIRLGISCFAERAQEIDSFTQAMHRALGDLHSLLA